MTPDQSNWMRAAGFTEEQMREKFFRVEAFEKLVRGQNQLPCGCWLYEAEEHNASPDEITINGRSINAQQFSWEFNHPRESIPEGHRVFATCGLSNCTNPAHLYVATEPRPQPHRLFGTRRQAS